MKSSYFIFSSILRLHLIIFCPLFLWPDPTILHDHVHLKEAKAFVYKNKISQKCIFLVNYSPLQTQLFAAHVAMPYCRRNMIFVHTVPIFPLNLLCFMRAINLVYVWHLLNRLKGARGQCMFFNLCWYPRKHPESCHTDNDFSAKIFSPASQRGTVIIPVGYMVYEGWVPSSQ